jgi:50S ribosome-binding GTPase/Domain of unknown function (DUF3482)
MTDIALSLVSHTNVGKTTLARTLLQRDVGEVRDAPHVTEFADQHLLIESPEGDRLLLWDTPGFGDSVRLLKRLRAASNPLGWFLSEVWDRWRDRAFWASQQALRHVREESSVVLYLVNAAEPQAGYLAPEMELLAWMDKPVLVLLNQLGAPRDAATEEAEVQQWREQLARWPGVRQVLPLDAFARCWVHEQTLLVAVQEALQPRAATRAAGGTALGASIKIDVGPEARANNSNDSPITEPANESAAAMARLRGAWRQRQALAFDRAMAALAQSLARLALLREPIEEAPGMAARLRAMGARLGGDTEGGATAQAAQRLAQRVQVELRESTAQLLALHGLQAAESARSAGAALASDSRPANGSQAGPAESAPAGSTPTSAVDEILSRVQAQVQAHRHVPEGQAALLGGAVTGALAGLKADVATGGLTLGGGMLAGAILGALGAAGLAHGVNRVRGLDRSWVTLGEPALQAAAQAALLRYLAVAHFGRGRGGWVEGEAPAHWLPAVQAVLAADPAAGAPGPPNLAAAWALAAGLRNGNEGVAGASGLRAGMVGMANGATQAAGGAARHAMGLFERLAQRASGSEPAAASVGTDTGAENGSSGASPSHPTHPAGKALDPHARLTAALQPVLAQAGQSLLQSLYPALDNHTP